MESPLPPADGLKASFPHRALLCLGSNLGPRDLLIYQALEEIKLLPQSSLGRLSSLLETEPYGLKEQPAFMNQVAELFTALEPTELLASLLIIENKLGRVREVKWGPRLIDIDILLMDKIIYKDDFLVLPHPDFHRRSFALQLLSELEPDLVHPVLNKTMQELYQDLLRGGIK